MSQGFDPYHKWLGIPPAEQPPHYYRLLGISLFETDPDVITYAADQRMAHVRTFQTGVHSALSQQLLNEIAAARVVLLSAEKKAVYDAQLRQAFAPQPVVPAVLPAAPQPIAPVGPPPLPVSEAPVPFVQVPEATPVVLVRPTTPVAVRRRNGMRDMLVALTVVLLLGGGIVAALLSGADPQATPKTETESQQLADAEPTDPTPEEPVATVEAETKQEPKLPEQKPPVQLRARVRGVPAPHTGPNTLGDLMEMSSQEEKTPQPKAVESEAVSATTPPPPGPRDLSDLVAAPGESGAPGPLKITFPSGKTLVDQMILKDAVYNKGGHAMATLEYPGHAPWASISHDNGILNGITVARYEDGQPMFYATYVDGKRDGILQFWTPQGQKGFWGQYSKGRSHGLCCLFQNDQPYLVLECAADQIEAVHQIAYGKLQKTFSDESEARADGMVKAALDEYEEIDMQLKQAEADFRDAAKEEIEKVRQQLVSKLNRKKREAIQARINQRSRERQEAIKRAARAAQGR